MILLKLIVRILRHYKYIVALVALLVFLLATPMGRDLWRSRVLTLRNTPVTLESVRSVSQLITATYYGEALCSLYEAYEGTELGDLFFHYTFMQDRLKQGQPVRHHKYYALLQSVSGISGKREFEQSVKVTPWKAFVQQHAQALHAAEQRFAHHQAHREALVYLGRGTVQAGFDLTQLRSEQLVWCGDTLEIRGFSPRILGSVIDPWFVAETHTPGFELVLAEHDHTVDFGQMNVAKEACIQKLSMHAIEHGILERALRQGEKELTVLLDPTGKHGLVVRIMPESHYRVFTQWTLDGFLNRQELAELAGIALQDTGRTLDSAQARSCVHRLEAHLPAEAKNGWWEELKRSVHHIDSLTAFRSVAQWGRGAHPSETSRFAALEQRAEKDWDDYWQKSNSTSPVPRKGKTASRNFGFHPYYMGSAYTQYQFDLLWGISYWGCTIDPQTGDAVTQHGWQTTPLVPYAQKRGTHVFLTVSNFGLELNKRFFANEAAQENLLKNIPDWLAARDADGVTIDFEEVPGSCRTAFNRFLIRLAERLRSAGYLTTVCLYAVDFAHVFDMAALQGKIDLFILMGYDYYYAGSKTTGPVAPLKSPPRLLPYNLERSVAYYLKQGTPREKLVLALPYYGRSWKAAGTSLPSPNRGFLTTYTYREIRDAHKNTEATLQPVSMTQVWQKSTTGGADQLWYDNAHTLEQKFRWIQQQGLAGAGMWALGYDGAYPELWNALDRIFGPEDHDTRTQHATAR